MRRYALTRQLLQRLTNCINNVVCPRENIDFPEKEDIEFRPHIGGYSSEGIGSVGRTTTVDLHRHITRAGYESGVACPNSSLTNESSSDLFFGQPVPKNTFSNGRVFPKVVREMITSWSSIHLANLGFNAPRSKTIAASGSLARGRSSLPAFIALLSLTGCSILFPEDPREGTELSEECPSRVAGLLGPTTQFANYTEEMGVPTFTFDITKMAFEDMQRLIVPSSDETAGTRGMISTNEISTAVAEFMEQPVDEGGSFFFGNDPALYRVRGGLQPKSTMIASGCARQQEGMRLIMIDVAPVPAEPEPEPKPAETTDETTQTTPDNAPSQNESQ